MARVLPPFPAVRAFEAAARCLSFKRAADELHVTESAISHQVKVLELYLGQPLFRRTARGVALTDAGKLFLPDISDALDRVSRATKNLTVTRDRGPLVVGMTSAFAQRWLLPRLDRFYTAWPHIELRVSVLAPPLVFSRDDLDMAVWYGRGDWPDLHAQRLIDSALFPVCNPKLLGASGSRMDLDDLRRQTLLHYDHGESWARWMDAARLTGIDVSRGRHFEDCNLMIQAAIEGHGIALTFQALVSAELEAGRLVRPFDASLAPMDWYYVVYPEAWSDRPRVAAFRDWLLEEAVSASDLDVPGKRVRSEVAAE